MVFLPFSQAAGSWRGSLEIVWSNPHTPSRVSDSQLLRAASCWSLGISLGGDFHNLSGHLVPVFDQPHIKEGFFLLFKWNFQYFDLNLLLLVFSVWTVWAVRQRRKLYHLHKMRSHFLEKLLKFASILSAKIYSKLGWRCKVLIQDQKRNLSTDTLAEAQKIKLPGVKAGIFTIDSNEQPHGALYWRDRRSHSIFFEQSHRKGCLCKCCLLMWKSVWGETTTVSMLQPWSEGRSSEKCQKVPVSSFSPVSAVPAKWSYSCAKEKCVW